MFFARASLGIFFLVAVQASLSNVSTSAVGNCGFCGPKNFLNVSTADFKSSFLFRALLILSVGYLDWSPPQILNFVSLQPSAIGSWNENTIYVLKKEIFQFLGIKSEVYNWKRVIMVCIQYVFWFPCCMTVSWISEVVSFVIANVFSTSNVKYKF